MDAQRPIALRTDRMVAWAEGPVGWIVFNNPEKRNAVSIEMWQGLCDAIERLTDDDEIRVIVLRGAGGRAFVSGADISQFEENRSSPETIASYDAVSARSQRLLENTPKPTIAMIEGWCIGGGVGVAITCDMRFAGESSRFGIPATRLGLGYGHKGISKLMHLVGPAFVKEIFFTARHFTAAEAKQMGLINAVLPDAELEASVRAICATIADNAPLTIAAVKRAVSELSMPSETADLEACDRMVEVCFASEDYIEGRRAFMEKRRPVFRGR